MDGSAFDRLSRLVATTGSRRGLLGLLSGLSIAAVFLGSNSAAARPGRKRRHHAKRQHRHAGAQRRKTSRHDAQTEACIPTGQACPSKKPRGKKGKKLGCNACCQGSFITEASGKKLCGCRPTGGPCTSATAASCCSGFCNGATCAAAPCSGSNPCPQCQTCGADGLCKAVANGAACDDGNACTQPGTCQGGVCVSGAPITCPTGQVCQPDGSCACDATSCPACQACGGDGACQPVVCDPGQRCERGACCYETTAAFQAALADPAGPTTIRLCAGTFSPSSPVGDAFPITRPVRIIGAGDGAGGTVLAQGGIATVVFIYAGTAADPVRLEHLAVTGGSCGVQTDTGRHAAMTDCTVRDNHDAVAPGMFNRGTLTLTRCQIRDNGAAPGNATGGGLMNTGVATLIDCCVTGNRQASGGGIYNGNLATLTLTDTRVFGNSALAGGGLRNDAPEANVTVTGATVICNNTADDAPTSNCQGLANPACGATPCPTTCTG